MQACLNPGCGINKERFMRRNEQTFEQTLEVLCRHYLQHVPNIDSFREERWLHYMSKINENLYNIYIFMLQMIHLYFFNVHHLAKKNKKKNTHTHTRAHAHASLHFLRKQVQKTKLFAHFKKERCPNQQIEINLYCFPFINHSSCICFALSLCGEQR